MDSTIVRMLILAAALSMAVLLVSLAWGAINETAPDVVDPTVDLTKITTQALCEAAGGTWTAANTPPCA